MFFIYTLSHPLTNEIKYVGQTNNLKNRYHQHINEAIFRYTNNRKNNWIVSLHNKNLKPVMEVLEETLNPNKDEEFWINQLNCWGFDLTNYSLNYHVERNQIIHRDRYLKVSATLKGRPRPKEVVDKISNSHKGKKMSESTKQKLSLINKGRVNTEKQIQANIKNGLKRCIKIAELDENKNIIKIFNSCKEVCEFYSISSGYISSHLKGKYKTCKKKVFIKLQDIV